VGKEESEPDQKSESEEDSAKESSEPSAEKESSESGSDEESPTEESGSDSESVSVTSHEQERGSDSEAASKEGGSDSESASKKASHPGQVEKFEMSDCTLEEHVKNHAFPAHVAKCGPCKFWKNRWGWSQKASCRNPVTKKMDTWLACRSGTAICLLCAAYQGPGRQDTFGQGHGSFRKWCNIARHGNLAKSQRKIKGDAFINKTHEMARQAWEQRLQAEALQCETVTVLEAASADNPPAVVRTREPASDYRAVIGTRTMLEVKGSFQSLDAWFKALAGEQRQALESGWHGRRLVDTMAHHERGLTHALLKEGTVFRLQADGLGRTYQVEIATVLW